MAIYLIPNGPMPTTAAQAVVTTSATLATLLQVKLEDTHIGLGRVIEWGISLSGAAAATPFKCELLTTGTVKATITEHVAAGILNLTNPYADVVTDGNPFDFTAAADGTGYTSSAEGTITQTQMMDFQQIAPTNQYVKQFPLGREPAFVPSDYLRIRVWGDGVVTAYCYVVVEV